MKSEITEIKSVQANDSTGTELYIIKYDAGDDYIRYCVAIKAGNDILDEEEFLTLEEAEENFNEREEDYMMEFEGTGY